MCGAIGVMASSFEKAFARLCDVFHQIGRGLQIPVRIGNIAVAEIGRQRQHVFRDVIAAVRAGFQCSDCEGVTQRMGRGPRVTRLS